MQEIKLSIQQLAGQGIGGVKVHIQRDGELEHAVVAEDAQFRSEQPHFVGTKVEFSGVCFSGTAGQHEQWRVVSSQALPGCKTWQQQQQRIVGQQQ